MTITRFRRSALLAVASAIFAVARVSAADAPTAAPTNRPTVGVAPSPTVAPASTSERPSRDPFRPFNLALRPKLVETPRTPLEQYDVGALKLVAVIYDTQNPKAMVEDDTGLGYTIGVGTKIGNQGGVVKMIDPERVVVEEEFVDFYGEKKKSEIVLRLKPEGEKRP
jgi:Tfp pilus assembly protein PilP